MGGGSSKPQVPSGSGSNAGGGATTRPGAALVPTSQGQQAAAAAAAAVGASASGAGGAGDGNGGTTGSAGSMTPSVGPSAMGGVAQQHSQQLTQQQMLPEMQNMLQQQQPGGLDVQLGNGVGQTDAAGPPVMLVRLCMNLSRSFFLPFSWSRVSRLPPK